MSKELRIMRYQNRITLLEGRSGRENGRIIAKLKRKLRAAGQEID